ncbi:MAG: iron ABC transporter permease [Candidatus Brockarchaeota archaeon]|nr:iron ABC transporter permease [Candidatus Brockarchaeota archaeon]
MAAALARRSREPGYGFLDRISANPGAGRALYSASVLFFFAVVLVPSVAGIFLKLGLASEALADPALASRAGNALAASFAIALSIALLDLLAGVPMAWLITKRRSKLASVVDTLADVPFVVPTVALGYSMLLFWSGSSGISSLFSGESLVEPGWVLVSLLHFAFSYPVVVRLMVGEFQRYNETYEVAARTLGASPFTAVRTVTFPILKPAFVAAFLLAFARSLSETGATVMVAGTFENGPVFIKNAKDSGLEGPMVVVSLALIAASVSIFAAISVLGTRLGLPFSKVWPEFEKKASRRGGLRDVAALAVFATFVIVPSLFVALPSAAAVLDGTAAKAIAGEGVWGGYWGSIALSYLVGLLATAINVAVGFPAAMMIARKRLGRSRTALMDALVNVPIIIPSIALGVSLGYFWKAAVSLPEFWTLVLVHVSITYTYFVRTISAAIEGVSQEVEETARTLGACPFTVFRRITLPLIKYSVFSGCVMVFTRSVDETGATIAVADRLKTAPVLLVSWVKNPQLYAQSTVALGVGFLVLTSFAALLSLRLVLWRR